MGTLLSHEIAKRYAAMLPDDTCHSLRRLGDRVSPFGAKGLLPVSGDAKIISARAIWRKVIIVRPPSPLFRGNILIETSLSMRYSGEMYARAGGRTLLRRNSGAHAVVKGRRPCCEYIPRQGGRSRSRAGIRGGYERGNRLRVMRRAISSASLQPEWSSWPRERSRT